MNRELEFEIVDNKILNVLDYDWFIDQIDAVYVRHSEIGRKSDYAIYIQQGSEIVELYYRTNNEMMIASEYKKLCASLKEVNPMFDNSVETFVLINYANLFVLLGILACFYLGTWRNHILTFHVFF